MSFDFESRHMIEAMRSGVPSRAVGAFFSSARTGILNEVKEKMERGGEGMVFAGRYGEGKTHLLNTIFDAASKANKVVSFVSLSKETPANNLPVLYAKLMEKTYLPGKTQSGFADEMTRFLSHKSEGRDDLLSFSSMLECDKLHYVTRGLSAKDGEIDDYAALTGDIMGSFVQIGTLKQICQRLLGEKIKLSATFSKTRHTIDYFLYASRLFKDMGYSGWVILIDEAELIGRLSRKSRAKAYANLCSLLHPDESLGDVFTLAAFSTSFQSEVIEGKAEYAGLEADPTLADIKDKAVRMLDDISSMPELEPLTEAEMEDSIGKIISLHSKAYGWESDVDAKTLANVVKGKGALLRTKLRAGIDYLDQLYQYGDVADTTVGELADEDYSEADAKLADLFNSDEDSF